MAPYRNQSVEEEIAHIDRHNIVPLLITVPLVHLWYQDVSFFKARMFCGKIIAQNGTFGEDSEEYHEGSLQFVNCPRCIREAKRNRFYH